MRRNPVAWIWLLGLVLAAALYAIGPDHILSNLIRLLEGLLASVQALLNSFAVEAYTLIRALAIAFFVVFLALAVLAGRRGYRSRGALAVVSTLFLILLYRPHGEYVSIDRWVGALVLAATGAAVMSLRLRDPG